MSGTSPLGCVLCLLRFLVLEESLVLGSSWTSSRFRASVVRAVLLGVAALSCVKSGMALLGGNAKSAGVEEGKSKSLIVADEMKKGNRAHNDAL